MLIILILAIIGEVLIADLILIAILWMMIVIRDSVAERRATKREFKTFSC